MIPFSAQQLEHPSNDGLAHQIERRCGIVEGSKHEKEDNSVGDDGSLRSAGPQVPHKDKQDPYSARQKPLPSKSNLETLTTKATERIGSINILSASIFFTFDGIETMKSALLPRLCAQTLGPMEPAYCGSDS